MSQTFLNQPLVEIPGPAAQPSGFGLYAAAAVLDSTDAHTSEGVRWLDEIVGGAVSFATGCTVTYTLAADAAPVWVEAPAFGVSAATGVDHPLGLDLAELQKIARTRLSLQESSAVEHAYWTGKDATGTATGAPALAAAATTKLAASAVSLAQGLGLLEEWLGGVTGALGVIHAPRHAVGTLNTVHLRRDSAKLRTLTDTPVAVGTGYPGTAPDGTARAAGTSWLYATGPVQIVRSPVIDLPADPRLAVNRSTDATAIHAARYVSVGHTVGAAAVQINLA